MRTAPRVAVDDRKSGWALMASMLLSSKRRGRMGDDAWIFSSNCVQLTEAIPLAMRDPKDLDDVLKTDKGMAKIEQDVLDGVRYGIRMMAPAGRKPLEVEAQERLQALRQTGLDERSMMIYAMKERDQIAASNKPTQLSSVRWKGRR